jgi:hypothetical protein
VPETLLLTTPGALVTGYSLASLLLDFRNKHLGLTLVDQTGHARQVSYEGPDALTLMKALNKANLSTQSLHRRILERLALDGLLPPGTVSGAPD